MEKFKNYVGQLRIYSFVDLLLLLIFIKADQYQFWGAVILHIAFLAYLESRHQHPYRLKVPVSISYVLAFIGTVLYGKIEALVYVFLSFLYTKKTKNFGFISPVIRALQNLFIVAGIVGYFSPITYLAAILFFLRNLAGDIRDIEKDKKEGMRTIPIIMGMSKDIKHIHLIATIVTSTVWWYLANLSISWLILVILIQIFTYNLTPRKGATNPLTINQ